MEISTLATVWAAIITTLAFIAYILVEYPKITSSLSKLNGIVIEFSQKHKRITKFLAVFSFFGSEFMLMILTCLFFDENYKYEFFEYFMVVFFLFQFIFWTRKIYKSM